MKNFPIFKLAVLFLTGLLTCLVPKDAVFADSQLAFPTNQKEIESALSRPMPAETRGLPARGLTRGIGGGRGVAGVVDDNPLPELKVGAMINFDFNSYTIRPESYALLDEFGKALTRGLQDAVIVIAGHTDSLGPEDYNQNLSVQRAKSVANYLTEQGGVDSSRLIVRGYGEDQPIADNESAEGQFKNRRVEFVRVE